MTARLLDRKAVAEELGVAGSVVEHIFRTLPVVQFPGSRRVYVREPDLNDLIKKSTYRGDRVR